MRKILVLFVVCFAGLITTAGAQSLADIAKQSRAQQKAHPNAPVIDNDVIPSVVDTSPDATSSQNQSADAKTDATDKKAAAPKDAGKSETKDDTGKPAVADDDHKKADELKKKIAEQRKEISQLERELNVAQREAGVRAAVYYADAGTMLRDSAKFAEDSRNLKAEIDSKTQALNAAKQKLGDLQEQARKAGISSSQTE